MLDRALYHSFFLNAPIGAYILSPSADPVILDVNDAFLRNVNHTHEQLVGKLLFQALPADPNDPFDTGVEALRSSLARAIETGQAQSMPTQRYPIRTVKEDGTEVFVERFWNAVNTPIFDENGALLCIYHVTIEVTEQKRAEEALREADRRKDEFLAMLAHELRNPLAPIMTAAELLGRKADDAGQVERTGAVILRQVKHLTGLVDDLLDVSRVTRGLAVIDKHRIDMRSILAQAVEQAMPLIQARRHRLDLPSQTQALIVCGDTKRLIQVVANLLNNAAKYTPPGGLIQVGMGLAGDRIHIAVSDNGIGMNDDLIARAFDLFAQAERGADRAQGGLGIGLAIVKRLVELHGGAIGASSDGPGKGSRFTVLLPQAPATHGASDQDRLTPGTLPAA
jgi:signal transduction histidine kinase